MNDIVLVEGNNELNVQLTPLEMIRYYCPYCLASLSSLSEFFNHLESVHFYIPEDYFYCPYCGDEFNTMEAFFSHLEAQHIDDITAPPILPPGYLENLTVSPAIVTQGEDTTISGSFVGPFPDAYTSYRLAFHIGPIQAHGPTASVRPSPGHFSGTMRLVDRRGRPYPPGAYPILTTCAWRHDPPSGPILERTIWLDVDTGLTITVLPA